MLTEISIFAPHRCHGGKTTRSAFKCYCLFVRYVNILTGSVLDSPINQLSLWSLSIPCLQALCKAAIYPICVICQLMDRHCEISKQAVTWNHNQEMVFKLIIYLWQKLIFHLASSISHSQCAICCIFGCGCVCVWSELRFRVFYYGKWRRWMKQQGF